MLASENLANSSLTKSREELPREDKVFRRGWRPQLTNRSEREDSLAIRTWLTKIEWRSDASSSDRNCIYIPTRPMLQDIFTTIER